MKYIFVCILSLIALSCPAKQVGKNLQYAFRHVTTEDGLSNNEILGLQFQQDGTLLVETQNGWNLWDGNKVTTVKYETLPRSISPTKNDVQRLSSGITLPKSHVLNTILDAKDDGRGNLWLATDHQGVFIYNKVEKTFFNLVHIPSQSTSLSENHVNCIAIARDGTVALGHLKKGLSIYKPFPFRMTHFQSSTWRNISAVVEAKDGDLWIGTDGYGLFNVTKRKHYDVPGNIVVSLLEDRQGRVWIGTYKEGLLCMENGKVVKHYTKTNSRLSDNNVYSLCQDRLGKIWIGTLFGHLQSLDPAKEQWQDFKSKGGKTEAMVMDFAYDGKDCLYAGTLWGLCRINIVTGERTQIFSNKTGKHFLHEDIQSVLKDSHGRLWFAHGKGITVWDMRTDSISYFTQENGLCDDIIRSICEDGKGRIWIGTSNGLSLISEERRVKSEEFNSSSTSTQENSSLFVLHSSLKENSSLFVFHSSLTTADGLLDNNLSRHSIIRLHDGNLIIGSYEGYSLINLTDKPCDMEQASPYEIGEEWTVWTSWQAILIYSVFALAILVIYLLMRRAKRRAIAAAIKKAEAVWKEIQEKEIQKPEERHEPLLQAQGEAKPSSGEPNKHLVEVKPSEIEITSLDEQFVKKCTKTVEDNITNDLTTEQLAEAMALTRGHLYKRLMALTGMAPSDFIRSIRLKRACLLLESSGMQVAEVAYAVGYSSPKIFSRNFKAEYGMTPTEYKKHP